MAPPIDDLDGADHASPDLAWQHRKTARTATALLHRTDAKRPGGKNHKVPRRGAEYLKGLTTKETANLDLVDGEAPGDLADLLVASEVDPG